MLEFKSDDYFLIGPSGNLRVRKDDEITMRLAMLFEAECEGKPRSHIADKYGISRQRFHQILNKFLAGGAEALKSCKRGPKANYRRTDEVTRQVIRYRFLDPSMSPEVISQKLKQCGFQISTRSVERVISEFGLQKKTPHLLPQKESGDS